MPTVILDFRLLTKESTRDITKLKANSIVFTLIFIMANLLELSRFISYVLRHEPEAIGLDMSSDGWVIVEELITKMNGDGKAITIEILKKIVQEDDKKRYSFSEDGSRIRANQGHSKKIDLKLEPITPPIYLFHGTAIRNLDSIKEQGLLKRERHHVHLSEKEDTAKRVGARYGKPVILTILSGDMEKAGHIFYRSENNVWLTDTVPLEFIVFPDV